MNALVAFAMAAIRRDRPELAKKVQPASYLVPSEPFDLFAEVRRRSADRLLIGRADWRHFQAAQLPLFADALKRSGPQQLFGRPARRLRLRRAIEIRGNPTGWSWEDVIIDA